MYAGLPTFILVVGGIVATYYLVLYFFFRKKLITLFMKGPAPSALQVNSSAVTDFPHQLIDRPIMTFDNEVSICLEKNPHNEEGTLEIVEDEESLLLKAAEIVVEKIQDVVSHIASNPPNPLEVTSKVKAIVSQYQIFHNTDYYDAINSYIAITVERDCGIRFTKEEVVDLWK